MHFQFPEAWYFLPLVVIPFLVNLQRYLNRQTVLVPSLFFLEKILRKSHRREIRLWELLVELFFLLGLIFLLSRPVFYQPQLGHDNLLVLLDDSPSMRYHFIPPKNTFFEGLRKMLEENRYRQIDIAPLSQLGNRDPYTFRTAEGIVQFYRLLPTYLSRSWSLETVKDFFRIPQEQLRYRNYDFIVYSDNKANHFVDTSTKITDTLEFPALINTTTLPPTPVLHETSLQQENFFTRENMEMNISISPEEEESLFVVVTLDGEMVFRKQVASGQGTVDLNVKFPVVNSKVEYRDAVRKLTIGLEREGVVFQTHTHVIYVYEPKTLALVPPDHPSSQFFQTLFAYDLEKGNLVLSPTVEDVDVVLVLDLSVDPRSIPSYKFGKAQGQKVLFFIDPNQSAVRVNQSLQQWGVTGFTVNRKKTTSSLDILEFSFNKEPQSVVASDLNIENYFDFSFFQPPDYVITSIQKRPFIFRFGSHAVFNGVGVESISREIDPRHLVWIYELLFSLWGKKPVHYVYSAEYSNRINPISQSLESSGQPRLDNLDSRTITVFASPVEEFTTSAVDPKEGWLRIAGSVNTFPVGGDSNNLENFAPLSGEESQEGWVWDWVSLVVILEILLLGLLIYATVTRWQVSMSSQKI